jgi:hypothetical protein
MTYAHGQWNTICDRCGFRYKSVQLRSEWTGLKTCCGAGTNNCWEARHPQDFIRGKKDDQAPPWVRSEPSDDFITPGPDDWSNY